MRAIDNSRIKSDEAWRKTVAAAEAAVAAGAKLSSQSVVWTSVKDRLAALSSGKCWYCESREGRSDNAVDHFRPKSKYPFLAFSLENFRYSCTFCNSRRTNPETDETEGKGDLFPLFDGSPVATRVEELEDERPKLIDPCVAAQAGLLAFLSDGRPTPVRDAPPDLVERVKTSITVYHLDHPELNEQRRRLALKLGRWINRANKHYEKIQQGPDADDEASYSEFVRNIFECISPTAELSLFARRFIMMHRSMPWIQDVLAAA